MCDLQLDYLCTYKLITEDNADEKGLSELMYQVQYLELFGLTNYDEHVIRIKTDTLFTQLENETFLEELFENHPYNGKMCKQIMFRTLFSYDYMDLFHKILYYYWNQADIDSLNSSVERLKLHMKTLSENNKLTD